MKLRDLTVGVPYGYQRSLSAPPLRVVLVHPGVFADTEGDGGDPQDVELPDGTTARVYARPDPRGGKVLVRREQKVGGSRHIMTFPVPLGQLRGEWEQVAAEHAARHAATEADLAARQAEATRRVTAMQAVERSMAQVLGHPVALRMDAGWTRYSVAVDDLAQLVAEKAFP